MVAAWPVERNDGGCLASCRLEAMIVQRWLLPGQWDAALVQGWWLPGQQWQDATMVHRWWVPRPVGRFDGATLVAACPAAGWTQRWCNDGGCLTSGMQRWSSDGGCLPSSGLGRDDGATMVAAWPVGRNDCATMVAAWPAANWTQRWCNDVCCLASGTQRWCKDGGCLASSRLDAMMVQRWWSRPSSFELDSVLKILAGTVSGMCGKCAAFSAFSQVFARRSPRSHRRLLSFI